MVKASAESSLGSTIRLILKSMRVNELSTCLVKKEHVAKNDKVMSAKPGFNAEQDVEVQMELHEFISVEDYYNDKSTTKKILRSGKVDTKPRFESTVECNSAIPCL